MAPADVRESALYPVSPIDAEHWIKEALENRRWTPDPHLRKRMTQRGVTMDDVLFVLRRPTRLEPYAGMGHNGGSCWRVFGRDLDRDRELAVGVEAYMNDRGKAAIICTVIDKTERRK